MTPWAPRQRDSKAVALAAALALHAALLLAVLMASRPSPLPIGTSVPVTIVASGPTTDSRPATAAPQIQAAQVEVPVAEAKPPEPAPPPAAPPPAPAEPAKPTHRNFDLAAIAASVSPSHKSFNLSALQADVARAAKTHPARPAMAARGPTRAETAPEARVDAGQGVSQSDIAGLSELLERLWNPNCSADIRVIIPVKFTIAYDGHVQGKVDAGGRESSSDPVVFAAARRAIDAVHQAAPYAQTYRGLTFTVRFDAKKACAERN
jgi:outer membrane biosynthesis protein TonB